MVVGEERQARNLQDPNGENPLVHGATLILGVDVWEHSTTSIIAIAARLSEGVCDHLVNWEYVDAVSKA
jgi:Fe-Mn family superoxide dismutase